MDLTQRLKLARPVAAAVVTLCAAFAVVPGGLFGFALPDTGLAHALLFYAVTTIAYAVLPFVRRGDIAMMSMWLVLAVGISPGFRGEEISASNMFWDMAGVFLAAGPIYIARFRQVAQGDVRPLTRRRREDLVIPPPAEPAPAVQIASR